MNKESTIKLEIKNLTKNYTQGTETLTVLKDINICIEEGKTVAIVGESGAGKSTLLHLLGLLDTSTKGKILINGYDYSQQNDKVRTKTRNNKIGFIYQFHHLLPEFTATENVAMPLIIKGMAKKDAIVEASIMLEELGLKNRLTHLPSQLSGGEQQRVAIARALINKPELLLCDEPTGNLDQETSKKVISLLKSLIEKNKTTAIIVTHDYTIAKQMDEIFKLESGQLNLIID